MTAAVIDFPVPQRPRNPGADPGLVAALSERVIARLMAHPKLQPLLAEYRPGKGASSDDDAASAARAYQRPVERHLSHEARTAMRSLWDRRYAGMRSAALAWQLATGRFGTRPRPEPWRRDDDVRSAFDDYATAARLLLRTPAALREHLLWKRRNGTTDLLPAAEIAAIIAADAAWLEARNGRMRRRQKA